MLNLSLIFFAAFLRAWVPRTDTAVASARPFDVFASELNALVELKPEGKVGNFQIFRIYL
jgi:hypothetical protein